MPLEKLDKLDSLFVRDWSWLEEMIFVNKFL